LGAVLGENVFSDVAMPPFDRATMDGFAVRSADVAGVPRELRVIGESVAGAPFSGRVGAGTTVRIMTGAKLPLGADAVVRVEGTSRGSSESLIRIDEPARAGQHVSPTGDEVRKGDRVLTVGRRIRAPEIAILASAGRSKIKVFDVPEVAILTTGSELVPIERNPREGQIRNSNLHALTAQARAAGAKPKPLGSARDAVGELRRKVDVGLRSTLFVTSGGVSMGKYDFVEDVLRAAGVEILFDRVAIRPGRPVVFGRKGDTLVFGLPGNPVSSFLTFELLVRRAIERKRGIAAVAEARVRATLVEGELKGSPHLEVYHPARVVFRPGVAEARLVANYRGSHDIASVTRANAFVRLPVGATAVRAGDAVEARLLDAELEGSDGATDAAHE
jgi:molybdopterin molybdotransferase